MYLYNMRMFVNTHAAMPKRPAILIGCVWRIQNNKDYFDQSLDEIKLLKYINEADPDDEHGMLRLFDYFYYKVGGCLPVSCLSVQSVNTTCT